MNNDKPTIEPEEKDPGHEPKAIGRPRLFSSPEEFDSKVMDYQAHCKETGEPVTWTGLALFMGFSSRVSIDEYLKYDGFSYSVKRAKAFVEYEYEKRLCGDKPTGAIFALKNFGWFDKTEIDHSSKDGSMATKPTIIELTGPTQASE
jgi:hypothetical protein